MERKKEHGRLWLTKKIGNQRNVPSDFFFFAVRFRKSQNVIQNRKKHNQSELIAQRLVRVRDEISSAIFFVLHFSDSIVISISALGNHANVLTALALENALYFQPGIVNYSSRLSGAIVAQRYRKLHFIIFLSLILIR